MQQEPLETKASRFFDDFVAAFRTFNGAIIAQRYIVPYLAFHNDGAADVFTSDAEVAAYFQSIVNDYHAQGCRSCGYDDLMVVQMGSECALATVTWQLYSENDTAISTWRESYNLCWVDDRFRVFASTDHVA